MKKNHLLFKRRARLISMFIMLILLNSCIKEVYNSTLTKEFSLQSANNGATYHIKVGIPANYATSTEKFATLYVLDGEENFDFVANECNRISHKYAVSNIIVVSIGYGNDRSIDYTPTKTSSMTGGGAAFLHFIETQLIPEIEKNFKAIPTRDGRIILGHSYGGLFGAYAYCVNNALFGNYILLSPSLWFDNLVALQLEKDNRVKNRDQRQLVFMGIGEAENSGRMQAPFEAFYQTLSTFYSNCKLSRNIEPDLDHVGSKNPNIELGLKYYFQNR